MSDVVRAPLSTAVPAARRDPRLAWYVLLFALAGLAALLLLRRDVQSPVLTAILAALGIANVMLVLLSLRARRDAGVVLLDLGHVPQRQLATLGLVAAVLIVLGALSGIWRGEPMEPFHVAVVFFFATHAAQAAITRRARLQLRERGLLLGTSFVPWSCIRGWAWTSGQSVSFVGNFPWLLHGEARLDLDAHDPPRAEVERVLGERVGLSPRP